MSKHVDDVWAQLNQAARTVAGISGDQSIINENMWIEIANCELKIARSQKIHRGKGMDTIFLLDISESMEGGGFHDAKHAFLKIMEGIELTDKLYGLQENVAFVTMGQETKVVQHLTCDYDLARQCIDTVELGGRTPTMAGLYLALAAIIGRGSISTINNYSMFPRIILLSDGCSTDSECVSGPDTSVYPRSEIDREVIPLATRLGAENHVIHCVPCGANPDMEFLRKIADASHGEVIRVHEVSRLGRFFKNLSVLTRMKKQYQIDWKSKETLQQIMRHEEGDAINENDIADMCKILEDTENLSTLSKMDDEELYDPTVPHMGTRVRRGPDWVNGNEDSGGPGTIIKHTNRKGWVKVEWDQSKKRGEYQIGQSAGTRQLVITNALRELCDDLIAPGCLVCRGPEWNWDNQDGGLGSIGVVYEVKDNGLLVHVRWPIGHRNWYRFGLDGLFDVNVWYPDDHVPGREISTALPPHPSTKRYKTHEREGPYGLESSSQQKLKASRLTGSQIETDGMQNVPFPLGGNAETVQQDAVRKQQDTLQQGTVKKQQEIVQQSAVDKQQETVQQGAVKKQETVQRGAVKKHQETVQQGAVRTQPVGEDLVVDSPLGTDAQGSKGEGEMLRPTSGKSASSHAPGILRLPISNTVNVIPNTQEKGKAKTTILYNREEGHVSQPEDTANSQIVITSSPLSKTTPNPPEPMSQQSENQQSSPNTTTPVQDPDLLYQNIFWGWYDTQNGEESIIPFSPKVTQQLEEQYNTKKGTLMFQIKRHNKKVRYRVFQKNPSDIYMKKVDSKDHKIKVERKLVPIQGLTKEQVKQYFKLLSEGSKPSSNIRLLVVGHERQGKTSTCRELLKDSVGNTEGTNGIEIYQYDYMINMKTKQLIKNDEQEDQVAIHKLACMCARMKNMLVEDDLEEDKTDLIEESDDDEETVPKHSEQETGPNCSEQEEPMSSLHPDHVNVFEEHQVHRSIFAFGNQKKNFDVTREEMERQDKERTIPSHLLEDVKKFIAASENTDIEDIAYLSVWDFGGEQVFYDSHHIFLSSDAVYLVVFNIDECRNNDECQKKCFDKVKFWLQSIASYVRVDTRDSKSPPIIMVGTHYASINNDKEKFRQICYEIMKSLDNETEEIIRPCVVAQCPVENKEELRADNGCFDYLLKTIIKNADKQSQWKKLIPAKWFMVERELMKEKRKGTNYMTLEQIDSLNKNCECPIVQISELKFFLKYLHLLGTVIFFNEGEGLPSTKSHKESYVIINPNWLVQAFRRIITDSKFLDEAEDDHDQTSFMWNYYEKDAILNFELIDRLFEGKKHDVESFSKHKEILLDFMENLGLITRPVSHASSSKNPKNANYYIVPAMLQPITDSEMLIEFTQGKDRMSTKTLCIKSKRFAITFIVFHKLLAICIAHFEKADPKYIYNKPAVTKDFACFKLKSNWLLCLFWKDCMVRATMFKVGKRSTEIKPGIGLDVRQFIEKNLLNIFQLQGQIELIEGQSSQKRIEDLELEYFLDSYPCSKDDHKPVKKEELDNLDSPEDDILLHLPDQYLYKVDLDPWFSKETDTTSSLLPAPGFLHPDVLYSIPSSLEIARLAKKLTFKTNNELKEFFLLLKLPEGDINQSGMENQQVDDRKAALFCKWKQTEGRNAKIKYVVDAYIKVGYNPNIFTKGIFEKR